MASFNTIVRQMTATFQWPKCLSWKNSCGPKAIVL